MRFKFIKDGLDAIFKMTIKGKSLSSISKKLEAHPRIQNQILPYISLVGGFAFDLVTLGRIDQTWSLFQQAIFLVLIFAVLYMIERQEDLFKEGTFLDKVWGYHESILQFLMGGLLSAYTLFYFKSASFWTLFTFVLMMVILLILNEKKGLHKSRFPIRHAMASLCVCSFLIYLIPIIFREVSARVFVVSIFASILIYFAWLKLIIPKVSWKSFDALKKIAAGIGVPLVFLMLYSFKLVPPVPMAALKMGMYHDVQKINDKYELTYNRPWHLFWQKGDQTFYASKDDRIYFFTSVFAPTSLKHKVFVHWQKLGPSGKWLTSDRIPIQIKGGREAGYRGTTYKENYTKGKWRVLLETQDQRELGRLTFEVFDETRDAASIKNKVEVY